MADPKSFKNGTGVQVKKPVDLEKLMLQLADIEVLVGFPEETNAREDGAISNATLGYIHDNGAPEQNIPARPFMHPGIASVQDAITAKMKQVGQAVTRPKQSPDAVEKGLTQIGLIAKVGIQNYLNAGVDPPLSEATLRARARKGRKGAKAELARRKEGEAPGTGLAKPLVDSGQLRNAVNYVIRSRKKRK